ncbi:MAG: DedA family protein [Anaerolineales bacterium]
MSDTLRDLVENLGYFGIFLAFLAEHAFPPIPGQIVIPVAAVLIVRGDMAFIPAWLSGTAGGTLGSYALYLIGRWADADRLARYGTRVGLSAGGIARARASFVRYGRWMVFFWHLTPVSPLRVAVSLLAGAEHMPRARFLLYCAAANALWIGGQLYAVVLLGDNAETLLLDVFNAPPGLWAGLVLGAVVAGGVWWRWRRHQARPPDDQ